MNEQQSQLARARVRYRLDAQSRAVLDAEIARMATSGLMVELTRPQMLHLLVARAAGCRCDAELRELPASVGPTAEEKGRWAVEADGFVQAAVQIEAQKLVDEHQQACLGPHQVLRVLLMRAARCRCGTVDQTV